MGKPIPYEENHRINNGVLEKKCSIHSIYNPNTNEWMPCTEEYFSKANANKTDGLMPYCKSCNSKKSFKWRYSSEENMEKFKTNMEKVEAKPERIQSNRKRAEKQRKAGKQAEWQRNNPERLSEYNIQHQDHVITDEQWKACKDYFNNSCAYCELPEKFHYRNIKGVPRKEDLHKEHVIHKGSNGLENCIPSCGSCNSKKWKFLFENWYAKGNPVYTRRRYNKIIKWLKEDYKKFL